MSTRRVIKLSIASGVLAAVALFLSGYTGGPVDNGGTVRGTVRLQGTAPRLAAHNVTKSANVCGNTAPNEDIVTGSGGALANAVVWIDGIQQGAPVQRRNITLDQQRCRYVPHVAATTQGSQLTVTSSDDTLHNVHAYRGNATAFNLAVPVKGMRVNRPLSQTGVLRFQCDAGHTWMSAFVHVFDHPYFAVTGNDGSFSLPDVPAGTYTLKVWHERLGEQTQQIEVAAGGSVTQDFRLSAR
jgi:plastocyanin